MTRLMPGVFAALLLVFLGAFHAPAAMAKAPTTPSVCVYDGLAHVAAPLLVAAGQDPATSRRTAPGRSATCRPSAHEPGLVLAAEGAPIHARYADGTAVYKGQQPPRLGTAVPDPAATGPHARLRWDDGNRRVYQAREFDEAGFPVRDIDFTAPTFPSGIVRPGHPIPQQHPWLVNDPAIGPKSGFRRGPGESW